MKKIPVLPLFISLAFIFGACSKEKKFERMLYKGEGEWGISSITYTLITLDENYESDTVSATAQNPGIFAFKKNGVGSYNFIVNNYAHNESFSWNVVNESSLTLSRNSEDYDYFTGDFKYISIAMTGEKTAKNKMTITGTEMIENDLYNGYTETELTATFTLEKK